MPADEPTALLSRLRERIRREGPLSVAQYMQACAADPEHGYWRKAASIGAAGDFITAPEISQVFGELIGLGSAVVWEGLGKPAPMHLVELGPGRGTLMRDALRAARAAPGYLAALEVHLVELSAPLREMQRAALSEFAAAHGLPLRWHAALGEIPDGPAIIIANEFLDALPIRQLQLSDGGWRERVIDVDDRGALVFGAGAAVRVSIGIPAAPGAILELREGEDALLTALAARRHPFAALLIDYGPAELGLGDTLQGMRRHAYADPLAEPGSTDLTAHVQFAALADKARAVGLAVDGPISQAEFLGRLGAAERAARLMASNPERAAEIEAGVQRLMAPSGMGQLFKVMVLRTPSLSPPPPFG